MFEGCLINSGKNLNVNVNRPYPVKNVPIQRHWRLNYIQKEVTTVFNWAKKESVELVVVIIPDYPPGVYGKYN